MSCQSCSDIESISTRGSVSVNTFAIACWPRLRCSMARRDDGVILQQMIDYARETVALSRGRTRADLDNDRLFNLAMTRLLEVIGESAVQLSESTRQKSTTIPWSQIIAVRNRLI